MLVGKIMTPDPITASPDTSHREAFELMRTHGIRRLPILDRGKLVGIVSESDLLSTQPSPATALSIHEIYSLLEKLKVRQFMARPVITVTEDAPVEAAANVMIERTIGCLPVMRGETLVGIITETDIFKALVNVLGGGREGLRFSVRVPDVPGKLAQIAGDVAEAGGNIVSVVVWRANQGDEDSILTIKEHGADADALRQRLEESDAEIVDLRHDSVCDVYEFGKSGA
ncbi:MAG: CBS and ACT domain-containing protein [Anaerolineae bacterium]